MTIASDYYAAVEGLFRHYNHKSTDQLLGEIMEELRDKGYSPGFCAKFLSRTLRKEADRLPTFRE